MAGERTRFLRGVLWAACTRGRRPQDQSQSFLNYNVRVRWEIAVGLVLASKSSPKSQLFRRGASMRVIDDQTDNGPIEVAESRVSRLCQEAIGKFGAAQR
jgi:hypothetical protein